MSRRRADGNAQKLLRQQNKAKDLRKNTFETIEIFLKFIKNN